jgi:integrase
MRKGNLFQRNGIWIYRKEVDGRDIRISTRLRDRRAAERRASELEAKLLAGRYDWAPESPLFTDWVKTFMKVYSAAKGAPERDRQMLVHALPVFGHKRLHEIRKSDCLAYLDKRRQDMSANPGWKRQRLISEGTVQRERSLLQAVLQRAIDDGYDFRNPWKSIPRVAYAVRDRVLSLDEQHKLLRVLRPRYQRFVLGMVGMGLRLEEVRGIDPEADIDWEGRLVRVTGKFNKTRHVPLLDEVGPILRAQLEADGTLWRQNPQRLREVLANAARKAGIPHLSPHALRHTFGHRFLVQGGDIYVLSKILGHSSVGVTERHYAHLLKEDLVARTRSVRLGLDQPELQSAPRRPGTKVVTLATWRRQRARNEEVRKTS